MLYYLLIDLLFRTTSVLEHLIFQLLLRNYELNIIYYYILLLKIYHDTINVMELYYF